MLQTSKGKTPKASKKYQKPIKKTLKLPEKRRSDKAEAI